MINLDVWKKRTHSGVLRQDAIRLFSFTYDNTSSLPVSISMPTTKLKREFTELPPVFQAFLPEGELYKEVIKHLEARSNGAVSDMDVLAAVGNNNVGVLNFTMAGQDIQPMNEVFSPDTINNADDELSAFNTAMQAFFLSGVSGVQPKFLARSLPMNNLIVKAYNPFEYPALTVVEHICMEIAKKLKFSVANTTLSKQGHVLFVERFDMDNTSPKDMEELCSILMLGTARKYDTSYEKVAKTIEMIDSESLEALFRQIVFHNLIRNGDAHLKNFAVLEGKLSPMYDALCTSVWCTSESTEQLALPLNGSKIWTSDKKLVQFGLEYCGLTPKKSKNILEEIKQGILSEIINIDGYASRYSGLRHIEPVLHNLKEHLLWGCGTKEKSELSLISVKALLKNDRLQQTFKDNVSIDNIDI